MTTDSTTPMKTCTKCDKTFPATREFFYKKLQGLQSLCKRCSRAAQREWKEANREKYLAYQHQYYYANHEHKRQYREVNREKRTENTRRWRASNLEKHKEYSRKYRKKHRSRLAENLRQWRKRNPEYWIEYMRQWHAANPDKARIRSNRRRAHIIQLPDTWNEQDWHRALEYWNGCCVVCGCQLRDLFGNVVPHADHWIPISHADCPGTIPTNMLPLCSHCNLSKNDSLPAEWLVKKFGKRKVKQILERVEAYFEWVRNQQ